MSLLCQLHNIMFMHLLTRLSLPSSIAALLHLHEGTPANRELPRIPARPAAELE